MNEYLPNVTIGCPISNRDYLIDRYLSGIYNLDYPKQKIKLYFLVNNCRDCTEQTLKQFKRKYQSEYGNIIIERYKTTSKQDKRTIKVRQEIYKRLADLRNHILDQINTEYFFSLDSDIIVNPNVLKELLKADKDIIAAVINNDKILDPYGELPNVRSNLLIKYSDEEKKRTGITHLFGFEPDEIVEVDVTGACVLLSNKACKETRYGFHDQGEDVAWAFDAQEKGFKLYAHTGLVQNHVMCEYQKYCIENKCQNPCTFANMTTKGEPVLVYQYKYKDNVIYPNLVRCAKLVSGDKALLNN